MRWVFLSPFNLKWQTKRLPTDVANGWQTTYLRLNLHERNLRITNEEGRASTADVFLRLLGRPLGEYEIEDGSLLRVQQQRIISVEDWHVVAVEGTPASHFPCGSFLIVFSICISRKKVFHLWGNTVDTPLLKTYGPIMRV